MVSEQRYLEASHVHIQAYGYSPRHPTWDGAAVAKRAAFAPLKAMVDEAPLMLDGVTIAVRQMPTTREAELSGFAVVKEIPGVGLTINGYTVPVSTFIPGEWVWGRAAQGGCIAASKRAEAPDTGVKKALAPPEIYAHAHSPASNSGIALAPSAAVTLTPQHIAMPIVLERIHASVLSAVNLSFTPSPVALRVRMLGLLAPAFPLRSVRLSIPLSPVEVGAVCAFLRTRARGLDHVELNGQLLAADDIGAIAAALAANGTITQLDLCSCRRLAAPEEGECTCEGSLAHPATRAHLAQIADIERRNRRANARVGSAAIRALVVSRVLLHAYEPGHTPGDERASGASPRQSEPPQAPVFRILDLPPEIVQHILSFCTDSAALTRRQWVRVLRRALDRGRIGVEAKQFAPYATGDGISAAMAEWATSGGFWWDHEYAPE
ncbi:hypothetical protein Q8F55_005415 [Vanrija albida]|uniref:F-box domain-containing protein n=1 Tax=Vanrija albida TaxID=181172 RepID=A0ABR3Q244_9TREE